ncbi:MAG: proton-conducting transporter membrane subunit [Candidatus Thiodiazotropha sp.]
MNAWLLLMPIVTPLLFAVLAHRLGSRGWLLMAAAIMGATGLLVDAGVSLDLSWLLLGTQLQLDATGRLFLIYGSLIWMLAALFVPGSAEAGAGPGGGRHAFLLAMSGNALLLMAADMLTFYLGFALMSLSAYGLVAGRSQRGRHAARIYLVFTLIGEMALFAALLLIASDGGSLRFADLSGQPLPALAVALLLLGFGIKVALPGLHGWLPLAYGAAPLYGLAVLSGPMMKAGLLGWLRFLPTGFSLDPSWGQVLIIMGSLGVALGILRGLMQRQPRAVLAYSSIAKMGLISALFGFSLSQPSLAPLLLPAVLAIALHHLLVKPMLFLGLGLWQHGVARSWILAGFVLLALSLAAAPLTGGGAAKAVLDGVIDERLNVLLLISGIGTTLLMVRFLWLLRECAVRPDHEVAHGSAAGWVLLLPLAVWGPLQPDEVALTLQGFGTLVAGSGLALAGVAIRRWLKPRRHQDHQPTYLGVKGVVRRIRRYASALQRPVLDARLTNRPEWRNPNLFSHVNLETTVAPVIGWLLLMLTLLGALALRT